MLALLCPVLKSSEAHNMSAGRYVELHYLEHNQILDQGGPRCEERIIMQCKNSVFILSGKHLNPLFFYCCCFFLLVIEDNEAGSHMLVYL